MFATLNIALVEDHAVLRRTTANVLKQEGHHVYALECAEDIEEVVGGEPIDLFILDLNLPGEDGISLARRLRASHPTVGIIMVTARNAPDDMATGFATGADIYLVKPVELKALLAAVNSLARRLNPPPLSPADLVLDTHKLILYGPNGQVHLTPAEQVLLASLSRAPSQRLDMFHISETLGNSEEKFNKASLEVRIVRLRKKLVEVGADPGCLKSIRLLGYQLCVALLIR